VRFGADLNGCFKNEHEYYSPQRGAPMEELAMGTDLDIQSAQERVEKLRF
jgi:hypothetical protein